jgi:Uma2 family endonuclease
VGFAAEDRDAEWLQETFLELDLPEGLRAEFIDGEIVVVPPPPGGHDTVVSRITREISANCPGIETIHGIGIETPRGYYFADLAAGPAGWAERGGHWKSGAGLHLVVEVTAARPDDDRGAKRLGYAEADVPLYLLVDREREECVLRANPKNGDYLSGYRVPMGEEVPLPEPFGFALQTDAFPK